jgi:signal transduction histidine kinase/ActR/RegA family two-component response regulator
MAKSAISRLSTFLSWDLDRLSVNATSLPPKTLDRFAAVAAKATAWVAVFGGFSALVRGIVEGSWQPILFVPVVLFALKNTRGTKSVRRRLFNVSVIMLAAGTVVVFREIQLGLAFALVSPLACVLLFVFPLREAMFRLVASMLYLCGLHCVVYGPAVLGYSLFATTIATAFYLAVMYLIAWLLYQYALAFNRMETALLAKNVLLTNVSHQLKTPLNGISGILPILLADERRTESIKYLQTAMECSQILTERVERLLSLSDGQRAVEHTGVRERCTVDVLATSWESSLSSRANAKGLALEVVVADGVPAAIEVDVRRLSALVAELLNNAIQHSDRGTVSLRIEPRLDRSLTCELRDDVSSDDSVAIDFIVTDQGSGMSADVIESIGSVPIWAAQESGHSGMDLPTGLPMSKLMAEQLGGSLVVRSEVGVGTTCILSLTVPVSDDMPLGEWLESAEVGTEADAEPTENIRAGDRGKRGLIVDDSAVNRMVLITMLKTLGFVDFVEAENGEQAVEAFRADIFDYVFMDIQMPVMDGLAATRAISDAKAHGVNSDALVVAVTANFDATAQRPFGSAGFAGHVEKPIKREHLAGVIFSRDSDSCETDT